MKKAIKVGKCHIIWIFKMGRGGNKPNLHTQAHSTNFCYQYEILYFGELEKNTIKEFVHLDEV